jgi:hypothetical protein
MQISWSGIPGFYDTMFKTAVAPLLFAALAAGLLGRGEKNVLAPGALLPRHEIAAVAGFLIAPLLFILGNFVSAKFIFSARYGLLCVVGAACGVPLVMYRATGGNRRTGVVILCILMAWLAVSRGKEAIALASPQDLQFTADYPILLNALRTGTPVVAVDPLTFMAADFYLPKDTLGRLYFVTADRQTARRHRDQDLVDQLVQSEARVLPLRAHVEPLADFMKSHSHFLLHAVTFMPGVPDVLTRAGWRFTLSDHKGSETLYDVSAPPAVSGAAVPPQ